MNNRYTFKAKRKDGQWVYGNLLEPKRMHSFNGIDRSDKFCLIVESSFANGGRVCVGKKHWVLRETLCQCTGLQDIDGKDIFENDIVELQYSPVDDTNKFIIKFGSWGNDRYNIETLGFYFKDYKNYDRCFNEHPIDNLSQIKENIKIVGNKFDKEED